jgi:hypothetical protein
MAAPGLSHFEDPAAARWEERECSSLELREVARPGLRRLWHASAPFGRFAVMLSHIAHVIEGETHNGGVIDVDLHSQPMRLLLVVGGADFGRSIDFGGSADLRAQHQGERNGGHSSEDGE